MLDLLEQKEADWSEENKEKLELKRKRGLTFSLWTSIYHGSHITGSKPKENILSIHTHLSWSQSSSFLFFLFCLVLFCSELSNKFPRPC